MKLPKGVKFHDLHFDRKERYGYVRWLYDLRDDDGIPDEEGNTPSENWIRLELEAAFEQAHAAVVSDASKIIVKEPPSPYTAFNKTSYSVN
jgi:hypothetical protein